MSKGKNQHVIPFHSRWAVKGFGNTRITAVTNSKEEAIKIARRIAKNQKSELIIHKRNGVIHSIRNYL